MPENPFSADMKARPSRRSGDILRQKAGWLVPWSRFELGISRIKAQNEEILDSGTGSLELSFRYFPQLHQTNSGSVPQLTTDLSFNNYVGPISTHTYTRYLMFLFT
jgi:hypothetical protein